jgi:hypothetical protein
VTQWQHLQWYEGTVDAAGSGLVTIVVDANQIPRIAEGDRVSFAVTRLAQKHNHQWTVFFAKSNAEELTLLCESPVCLTAKTVPNHALEL